MVKKWGCFSAVKRIFVLHSRKKLSNDSMKKSTKGKKKKGLRIFKGPSSVEKIFWDFEREQKSIVAKPLTTTEQLPLPNLPFYQPDSSQPSPLNVISEPISSQPPLNLYVSAEAASLRAASPEREEEEEAPSSLLLEVSSPKAPSPEVVCRPESNLVECDAAATKIQAAYRGYRARRSYRAQKGLQRLQGLVKGQSVKRQTVNAMKQMKLLVRIQSQLHSQRVHILVNQPQYHQPQYRDDKEVQSSLTKSSVASGAGDDEDWDGSVIKKEELDARLRRKAEAAMGRERATIYAYSHQLGKVTSKSSQAAAMDFLSGGFPWGWSWLERQLPQENPTLEIAIPSPTSHSKKNTISRFHPSSYSHHDFGTNNADTLTPESTKSSIFSTPKPVRTSPLIRTPQSNSSKLSRFPRPRVKGVESPFDVPSVDNESLTSCPAFSVPRYMAMTASAKAKVRSRSNPKERFPGTPSSEVSRRLSYPFTPAIGSSNGNNAASLFSPKSSSQSFFNKNRFSDNHSVHSMVSLPAGVGRKPFNRFV